MKKIFFISISLFLSLSMLAQTQDALQKAFSTSYLLESKGDYVMAISAITALSADASYECNLRLGWLSYLNKNYPVARQYYSKAIALKPYSIEAQLGLVKPLAALESWDEVKKAYEDIMKIDAQNLTANYWLGMLHYNRKEYDAAARLFQKVVNLYPFDYDANHMLGWTYLMQGKKAEARMLFGKALLYNPTDPSAQDGYARCN